MVPAHTQHLCDDLRAEDALAGKLGRRLDDEQARILGTQKADLQRLHVDKVARPTAPHLTHRLHAAEEESQARTILNDAAKPVKQRLQVDMPLLSSLFQLLELVEGQ